MSESSTPSCHRPNKRKRENVPKRTNKKSKFAPYLELFNKKRTIEEAIRVIERKLASNENKRSFAASYPYRGDDEELLELLKTAEAEFLKLNIQKIDFLEELAQVQDEMQRNGEWPYASPSAMLREAVPFNLVPKKVGIGASVIAVLLRTKYFDSRAVVENRTFVFRPVLAGYERTFTGCLALWVDDILKGSGFRCLHNVPVGKDPQTSADITIVRDSFVEDTEVKQDSIISDTDCKNSDVQTASEETVWYNFQANFKGNREKEYIVLPCTRSHFVIGTSIVPHGNSLSPQGYYTALAVVPWTDSKLILLWMNALRLFLSDINNVSNYKTTPQPVEYRRVVVGPDHCIKFFGTDQETCMRESRGLAAVHEGSVLGEGQEPGAFYLKFKRFPDEGLGKWSLKQVKEIFADIRKCHDCVGVHGDVRLANMLRANPARLIDFELAGVRQYPGNYNGDMEGRHQGAKPGAPTRKSHDLHSFLFVVKNQITFIESDPESAQCVAFLDSVAKIASQFEEEERNTGIGL